MSAGRVRDLWHTAGTPKRKTSRHPDMGGNPKSARWLAVWQDPGGRERTKAFQVKAVAAEHAAKMASDVARGDYMDPALGRALVDVLAKKYLSLLETGAATRTRYEQVYRLHIKPVFGKRPAGGVQPSEIAAWSRSLADHPATRQMALMILGAVFELAVADGVRRDNPVRSPVVIRPRQVRAEREPWTADMVHAVAAHCATTNRGFLSLPLVAAGLGLRAGEVYGLAATDIDTEQGIVTVRRQVALVGKRWVFKLPKSGKVREVPLSRGVAALLSERNTADFFSLPWAREDGTVGRPVKVELLFRWRDGGHIRSRSWDLAVWKPALAAAGIIKGDTRRTRGASRENGMHALRHFYSTTLLDAGVSLAGVMEFMGHSRKNVPLPIGVYGHVTEATLEAARQAVDQALFRPRLATSDGTVTELAGG